MPAIEREAPPLLNVETALQALSRGDIEVKGRLPWSSNATLLVEVGTAGASPANAVYKFTRGERELWDFPSGLWRREVAAFELSRLLGWDMVPPTIARPDAPLGEGSLQLFVDCNFAEHYFTLRDAGKHDDQLRRIATFDLLANNADRKGGHILLADDDQLWGIDHGLCFATGRRLRTVMWDYAGDPIPETLLADIERVTDRTALAPLTTLLDSDELDELAARAQRLLANPVFPEPVTERQYPWPLV
ncbi:MAG TPA: SCO1664 family protein [Acidimicrobiales bacterium]|nr:SCO1664 family protein [Acidimicrobiales bacterium]